MIHILFVPGMFGSTIEYVLRSHTNEYEPIAAEILSNGSMHSYAKQAHIDNASLIKTKFAQLESDAITTPVYPTAHHQLPELIDAVQQCSTAVDKKILICADSLQDAELNMLFQYHKIVKAQTSDLEVFIANRPDHIKQWNPSYSHWTQMSPWEMREWISFFYIDRTSDWLAARSQTGDDFLIVRNSDLINLTYDSFLNIIEHCGLTAKPSLADFATDWRNAQQYIIDEFELIDAIVNNTINNVSFEWSPLNIVAEAIVQQRLRALKYSIRCDGLNIFPTDSFTLHNLLEKH